MYNQHPGMLPSGAQQCILYKACDDSDLPSFGWRETLVLRFLPSQASQDLIPALHPSFFSHFPASGWRVCPHLFWDYALYFWISKAFYDCFK